LFASGIAVWFMRNPSGLMAQRYVMSFVLVGLAIKLLLE